MEISARSFLEDLLSAPGVSGYEQAVQEIVLDYVKPFAEEVQTDLHGNVIATINAVGSPTLMFDGHCDQLGMVVSHIDESGYLFFQTVGGWDPQQLVGQRVNVWAADTTVPGVISRKAIHLLTDDEKKKVVDPEKMWVDIGAKDRDDAASVISIGDAITVQLGIQEMWNGIANAPAMDNRTGVWVVFEAMRRAADKGVSCKLVVASTVQEEIGLRGARTAAYSIDPQVAIAVDVTHATDCPGVDKRQLGIIDLGAGPVIPRGPNINPRVHQRLELIAKTAEIPFQVAALGRAAPNDSNALQITRAGVATGLVQLPNRYMHSAVETVALSDLDDAANLLAQFACEISLKDSFVP
ncbi:MAG TPA: hydrolase [Gemmatimonadetes bacterium]|nr:hydrolase [Gemmatimonadota bacterium]